MRNVPIFTIRCLFTGHGYKQTLFALYYFDVVNYKTIVKSYRYDCFHFGFFCNHSNPGICYLHTVPFLDQPLQYVAIVFLQDNVDVVRSACIVGVCANSVMALNYAIFNVGIVPNIHIIKNDGIADH